MYDLFLRKRTWLCKEINRTDERLTINHIHWESDAVTNVNWRNENSRRWVHLKASHVEPMTLHYVHVSRLSILNISGYTCIPFFPLFKLILHNKCVEENKFVGLKCVVQLFAKGKTLLTYHWLLCSVNLLREIWKSWR